MSTSTKEDVMRRIVTTTLLAGALSLTGAAAASARARLAHLPGLLPGLPVDRLPQQVRVPVVPRVLLDHVHHDPAEVRRATVRPDALGERPQAAVGERLVRESAGQLHRALP